MGNCLTRHIDDGDESTHVELGGGNVAVVTTKEVWDQKLSEANREGKIVIANFSAAWCGPCKLIAPYYSELSLKYTSLMFLTIDVDELADLGTSYEVKATPTFFFLKNGQQIDKLVGSNKSELVKKITAVMDSQGECQPE